MLTMVMGDPGPAGEPVSSALGMVLKQAVETHLIDDTSQPARAVNRIAADHRPRRWGNRLRVSWALFMFYRVPVAIDIEGGYVRSLRTPLGAGGRCRDR